MKLIINTVFTAIIASIMLVGCKDSQSPGVEYMPDMYRSPAIEVYVDYEFPDSSTSLKAPENSIPRGYKPYAYPNTNEGFELAGQHLKNPLEITEKTIKQGQKLYTSFCAHCHGKKGDGAGTIKNPIYGAVPSYSDNVLLRRGDRKMNEFKEGHIYHTIMFGLNAMGPHSSLIREQDRWKIVAYVQTLQGKGPMAKETVETETEVDDESNEEVAE